MKLSIITINYNDATGLLKTIESVVSQFFTDFEFIVIDGGSSDNSLEVIKKFSEKINYWISEKDDGIYYAMNKGLQQATGEWVSFMNSGDTFFNNTIISEIFQKERICDIMYGDNVLRYDWGSIVLSPDALENMSKYMVLGHQTCFVKREILNIFKFDTKFKVSADYNLFYTLHRNGYIFEYIPKSISICDASQGASKTNPVIIYKEDAIITSRYYHPLWRYKYILFLSRLKLRSLLLMMLPNSYINNKKKNNIIKNKLVKQIILQ